MYFKSFKKIFVRKLAFSCFPYFVYFSKLMTKVRLGLSEKSKPLCYARDWLGSPFSLSRIVHSFRWSKISIRKLERPQRRLLGLCLEEFHSRHPIHLKDGSKKGKAILSFCVALIMIGKQSFWNGHFVQVFKFIAVLFGFQWHQGF